MNDLVPAVPACAIVHVAPHVFSGARSSYHVRPARPDDEPGLRTMLQDAAPDDIRLRFFRHIRLFPHEFIEPLTRMDDACNFAFVATRIGPAGATEPVVASAMMVSDANNETAEFGIFVARPDAGQRLGSHLLDCLIREARGHGIGTLYGLILAENAGMVDLARRLGFRIASDPHEPGCVRAELPLAA